ncbi:MAG: hypothetical protein JWM36_824 [Hyphomicrobiales bacterium]|nr:hypothetical protein [Hyphomicrobiales bacterium]
MLKFTAPAVIAVITMAACNAAVAQQALDFDGTAASSCALTNPVNGTIALQTDLRSWATGSPASIVVTNTSAGTYDLSITHGETWTSAPTGTPATTTFAHSQSITGANQNAVFSTTGPATSTNLAAAGEDNVQISLTASSPDPYRAGPHKATVTVTCAAN